MDNVQKQLIQYARNLIEKGWHKGWFACDANQTDCSDDSPKALAFCSVGALSRACYDLHLELTEVDIAQNYIEKCIDHGQYQTLVDFNDANTTTKSDILALFDKALSGSE